MTRVPSAWLGWALAVAAVAAGYAGWGWRGVLLAVTVLVFWLLLQFSRALRTLRQAAQRPVGRVANAVMLNARLHRGQRLAQLIPLTGSLGQRLGESPERWGWEDAAGDRVELEFDASGRLVRWQLVRAAPPG